MIIVLVSFKYMYLSLLKKALKYWDQFNQYGASFVRDLIDKSKS